ncbi:MAG: phosphate ABC transporter permease subunit PstC [Eubacteriales bacterium]|nr:phosphate ABC transporter permease subunit PstC [Eubacteriales bacterium]
MKQKIVKHPIRAKIYEWLFRELLRTAALITILTTVGIVLTLLLNTFHFFEGVSPFTFLTGTQWTPLFADAQYGVLPLVMGTFVVAIGAALFSIPVGLVSAIYLSEYAHPTVRKILKPALEILAGIPSIVYGYFALTEITPLLQKLIPSTNIYNALSASIAIGIMTVPLVASLSEDAMTAVPDSYRQGAYALGATRLEVVTRVVLPSAISGLVASFILAISRAVGETMIVALAAGAKPSMSLNPLQSVQTLTGFIAQASMGDNPHGTMSYYSLYAVGLLLFLLTLGMNVLSRSFVRSQEKRRG